MLLLRRLLLLLAGLGVAPTLAWASGPAPPTQSLSMDQLSVAEAQHLVRSAPQRLRQARLAHDSLQLRQLHWATGQAYHTLRRYDAALRHYRRALALSPAQSTAAAWSGWLVGGALYSQGDTGQARHVYQKALYTFRQQRDVAGQGRVLEQLGELYGAGGQWSRARHSYEQALAAWQLAHNNPKVSRMLNRIGLAHQRQRNFSRALYYMRQSLATAQENQDSAQISDALTSTGHVYRDLGNPEVAQRFFAQALVALPVAATPLTRTHTLRYLAATHDSLGNYAAAARYLRQALPAATQTGSKVLLSQVLHSLARAYERDNQPRLALATLTRYTTLQDSVLAEQRSAQVAELQTRYETQKKEQEIRLLTKNQELQEANLRRQKLQRNWLAVGAMLLLAAVAALYQGQRQQRHANRMLQRKNAAINRQKEELDRLNRTKDTLFSIISHDLRSPLSSLYSVLSLLKLGRLTPQNLVAQSERLTRMLDSTLHLLDNLLNWSAAQLQGESSARPERLRLDVLAEETVALLIGDAERKGIALRNQVPEGCVVRADINMTRLILRNLLSNALKFTGSGGAVTLAAERCERWWEVRVQDTGIGIPLLHQAQLLGQAGHFSTRGTAQEKGTGLGLRLCREFVERNGGELTFLSVPGEGSVFRFTLPVLDEEPAEPIFSAAATSARELLSAHQAAQQASAGAE